MSISSQSVLGIMHKHSHSEPLLGQANMAHEEWTLSSMPKLTLLGVLYTTKTGSTEVCARVWYFNIPGFVGLSRDLR